MVRVHLSRTKCQRSTFLKTIQGIRDSKLLMIREKKTDSAYHHTIHRAYQSWSLSIWSTTQEQKTWGKGRDNPIKRCQAILESRSRLSLPKRALVTSTTYKSTISRLQRDQSHKVSSKINLQYLALSQDQWRVWNLQISDGRNTCLWASLQRPMQMINPIKTVSRRLQYCSRDQKDSRQMW